MKRVVLDTNVLAAAFRSRNGASFLVMEMVASRQIRMLATTALLLEYEAVLKRPEQLAVHGLSLPRVDEAVEEIAALSEPVEIHFQWRPQLSDPKDELVIEAAINGRTDALVTHNVRDFEPVAGRFGVPVLRPANLLEQMRP